MPQQKRRKKIPEHPESEKSGRNGQGNGRDNRKNGRGNHDETIHEVHPITGACHGRENHQCHDHDGEEMNQESRTEPMVVDVDPSLVDVGSGASGNLPGSSTQSPTRPKTFSDGCDNDNNNNNSNNHNHNRSTTVVPFGAGGNSTAHRSPPQSGDTVVRSGSNNRNGNGNHHNHNYNHTFRTKKPKAHQESWYSTDLPQTIHVTNQSKNDNNCGNNNTHNKRKLKSINRPIYKHVHEYDSEGKWIRTMSTLISHPPLNSPFPTHIGVKKTKTCAARESLF